VTAGLPSSSPGVPAHENPFRVSRLEALPYRFPSGRCWERLFARLEALGGRGAVVGPEGSGKTALLAELAAALGRGMDVTTLRLTREQPRPGADELRRLAATGPADAVILDGAEQLGPLAWRRARHLTRHAGALVITGHRPGRLPTLLATETSVELLADLVGGLLPAEEAARLEPLLPELVARHQGNLRTALLELYDRWSRRPQAPAHISYRVA